MTIRRQFGISVLCCLLLSGAACSQLPGDWPIKELTLPSGSSVATLPRNARTLREKLNHIEGIEHRLPLAPKWEVAFNNKKASWESIVSHVGSQLTPLGFTEWKPRNAADADTHVVALGGSNHLSEVLHIYESSDGKLLVNLINTSLMTSTGDSIDIEGNYILAVFEN
jgi:hypothetical protein